MTALTDLLDAHRNKLNEHTVKIKNIEERLAKLEHKGESSFDFTDSVSRWVQSIKDKLL